MVKVDYLIGKTNRAKVYRVTMKSTNPYDFSKEPKEYALKENHKARVLSVRDVMMESECLKSLYSDFIVNAHAGF